MPGPGTIRPVTQARPSSAPAPALVPNETGEEVLAEDQPVPLRLTVTRGVLGLELYEPVDVGPLTVAKLALVLPNLKFPVDLSGGVARFRHRRGDLEHLRLALPFEALARFLSPGLKSALPNASRAQVWGRVSGFGVGVTAGSAALAFDVLWAPTQGDARFVVGRARGVGLTGPALGHALRALDSVLGGVAERRGRLVSITKAGALLGKVLMPAVGARAPGVERARFGDLVVDSDRLEVDLDAQLPPPALGVEALRDFELALLVADADEQLARGDVDAARAGYLQALERGPRHPEIVRMIAEIDSAVGGRGEAALGLLVESLPAHRAGLVGAELLAAVGDLAGAREALREALRDEPFAPLAALAWTRLAGLETNVADRRAALDAAVARAPGLSEPRWARFSARLAQADVNGALADAEHLEAVHTGARARHEACRRAARALLDHGYVTDAGRMFERSLRYAPDDPAATAGLARALLESGKKARAAALFERAIQLGERRGRPDADALVDLARLLADEMQDLPQAIVRVREVSADSPRLVEARRLEGLWRSRLGDLAGASIAYGRMREAVELGAPADAQTVEWLVEAAGFEREAQLEISAAERHLGVALRLSPHDPLLAARYREVAGEVAERLRKEREARRRESR
jgi:tetratricopeptide (TPR) repeat protein